MIRNVTECGGGLPGKEAGKPMGWRKIKQTREKLLQSAVSSFKSVLHFTESIKEAGRV